MTFGPATIDMRGTPLSPESLQQSFDAIVKRPIGRPTQLVVDVFTAFVFAMMIPPRTKHGTIAWEIVARLCDDRPEVAKMIADEKAGRRHREQRRAAGIHRRKHGRR